MAESDHSATLNVVAVRGEPLDAGLGAPVAAAWEAMVNAARHGGGQFSLYAECRDDVAEIFVRDRGSGFALMGKPDDRQGMRESNMGRMERNGRSATFRDIKVRGDGRQLSGVGCMMDALTKCGQGPPAGRLPTAAATVAPEEERPREGPVEGRARSDLMAGRKQSRQQVAIARDVPRLGFECGSYRYGHNVHYIPVLTLAPSLEPIPARLVVAGEGLSLERDGDRVKVFHHNPAAVALLVDELGAHCEWFASLHLARWVSDDVHHWASLAAEPVDACPSREDVHLAELRHWS